jgi:hypothetical protein
MAIAIPNIDDRRYDDLVDEAISRISVHTPEWTDFNDRDPGITLLQLFAFVVLGITCVVIGIRAIESYRDRRERHRSESSPDTK